MLQSSDDAERLLAQGPTLFGPGWRNVGSFEDPQLDIEDLDDEYESEEEMYVTIDLGSTMDSKALQTETQYQLIGLDTPLPFLKVGNHIFQGQITPLIGTEVVLGLKRDHENPQRPSHPPLYTTSHRISFRGVTLQPRAGAESASASAAAASAVEDSGTAVAAGSNVDSIPPTTAGLGQGTTDSLARNTSATALPLRTARVMGLPSSSRSRSPEKASASQPLAPASAPAPTSASAARPATATATPPPNSPEAGPSARTTSPGPYNTATQPSTTAEAGPSNASPSKSAPATPATSAPAVPAGRPLVVPRALPKNSATKPSIYKPKVIISDPGELALMDLKAVPQGLYIGLTEEVATSLNFDLSAMTTIDDQPLLVLSRSELERVVFGRPERGPGSRGPRGGKHRAKGRARDRAKAGLVAGAGAGAEALAGSDGGMDEQGGGETGGKGGGDRGSGRGKGGRIGADLVGTRPRRTRMKRAYAEQEEQEGDEGEEGEGEDVEDRDVEGTNRMTMSQEGPPPPSRLAEAEAGQRGEEPEAEHRHGAEAGVEVGPGPGPELGPDMADDEDDPPWQEIGGD